MIQDSGPSTLFTPAIDAASSSGFGVSPILLIVGGMLLIGVYLSYVLRHRRNVDPRELAFRKISRKMGFSNRQINLLRQHAISMGLSSPVGVVMNPRLITQALGE